MKLQVQKPSENVLVVAAEIDGQTETIVLDTAAGTRPEALRDFASDRGGTAPIDARPRGPGDAGEP